MTWKPLEWHSIYPSVSSSKSERIKVRITPEILAAYGAARRKPGCPEKHRGACPKGGHVGARRIAGLKAAFEAAGFEVIEGGDEG